MAVGGAALLLGEVRRPRRRRQGLEAQDRITDAWLRRLGWSAVWVLITLWGLRLVVTPQGPS